jgi:hypothetical protein
VGVRFLVNVAVTCTDRKRLPIPESLRLRSIPGNGRTRAESWIRVVEGFEGSEDAPLRPALELYAGDHWRVVQSLQGAAEAREVDVRLWVLSAGYGLTRASDHIAPYAATFSPRHPDSVHDRGTWWRVLTEWTRPLSPGPRSLVALASAESHSPLIVAASGDYLQAVEVDLLGAIERLSSSDLVSIVSAVGACPESLSPYLLPSSARLQAQVGGARQSLSARILRLILDECVATGLRRSVLVPWLATLVNAQPPLVSYDRSATSDASIRDFIRRELAANDKVTHTRLLRKLRDSGRACEQKRFRDSFYEVRQEILHG